LGRVRRQRGALLKNLMENLVRYEKIKTTEVKAKELRPFAERLITKSRRDTVVNRRHLARYLTPAGVKKLFAEISPRYQSRPGGYTRIYKLPSRKSDGSKMAIIELI
jgi:large subunit ribosomal protein L17